MVGLEFWLPALTEDLPDLVVCMFVCEVRLPECDSSLDALPVLGVDCNE